MKEGDTETKLAELRQNFRKRLEKETKALIDLGLPSGSTEKILMNRVRTDGANESKFSKKEIMDTIVQGRLRWEEAERALVLDREFRKLMADGLTLAESLEKITERLGKPKPSVIDEIQRAHGLENESCLLDDNIAKKDKFEKLKGCSSAKRPNKKLHHLLSCQEPLFPDNPENASKCTALKLTGNGKPTTFQPSRKRNVGVLLNQSCEFKKATTSSRALNILRRKKQKQKK
uniref:Uncharacterized protein n=1 Tax=Lotharella oceanica TaxID=641309 RepID=A0A7S2U345_9EUKA|mmetsp:Transcript_6325/g.12591  ORF Transcript_6325/g.12591 Transcript_6325/m.12591 type:complete len:232 (+) Transcript_6325:121-816(+)